VGAVAVIAVPDVMRDEEVFAAIVPAPGHAADCATAETILDFARNHLAYYKLPGWIVFRDSLPVTGTQKVQKHRLYPDGTDPCADPAAFDLREAKGLIRKARI
jgi:crotonobetaine/carnitine-CoA ligase